MKTNLKEIRKARGYKNAKEFAESIGMQEKTYRNYENGSRNLYLDVACKLCTALNCTLEDLTATDYFVVNLDVDEKEKEEEEKMLQLWRNADSRARRLAVIALEDGQKSNSVPKEEIA